MKRQSLDKVIIAEKPEIYIVGFENTCGEFNKDSEFSDMLIYLRGIYIGCYGSGNLMDSKNFIQNGYTCKDKWKFGGNPLPEKDFEKILDSLWPKGDESFY